MIRLRALGQIELYADDGGDADALVAQPKRFALLCYLAVPKPGILFRRDTLLGVFWPEGDTEHSRTALRQALAHIRRALGEDLIVRRGGEEVGLNSNLLRCDVSEFDQALDECRWTEAVKLYRGELLKDFYLPNGPEFERWLDAERSRLADRYAKALEQLAREASAAGKTRAAVEWWQALTLHDPFDSRYAMRLMEALDRAGDPANALLHARRHTDLLRGELEIGPPVEFEGLVTRIRQEHEAADALGGEAPAEADERSRKPGVHKDSTQLSTRPVGRRSWPKILAAGAAIATGLIVLAASLLVPRVDRRRLAPDHVAVAVFRNATGDPSYDLLGERTAHWVTQGIQQAEMPVSPWEAAYEAWKYVETEIGAGRQRDPIQAMADETGAGTIVSGAIYRVGDSHLEIVVSVSDAHRGRLIGTLDPVIASADSIAELLRILRQKVTGFLAVRSDDQRAAPLEFAGEPPPFDAYVALRTGMSHFNRGEHQVATGHFRRAFDLDSTYAEALLFLALTHRNLGERHRDAREFAASDSVLRVVSRLDAHLTPYYRNYLECMRALIDGDLERSRASIRRAAQTAPRSRAWYSFGVLCYWTNRPLEAVEALSTLSPDHGAMRGWIGYSGHLTEILFTLGRHEEEYDVAQRAIDRYPNQVAPGLALQTIALAALGRMADLYSTLDELERELDREGQSSEVLRPRKAMVEVVEILRQQGHATEAQEVLERTIRRFETRPRPESATPHHRLWYAKALWLAGRAEESQRILDDLTDEMPDYVTARGTRAFVAAARGDTSQARVDIDWLSDIDSKYLYGEHTYWRAVAEAWLGNHDLAVSLLRASHAQGRLYLWYDAVRADLDPLRGNPQFEEWLRPKG